MSEEVIWILRFSVGGVGTTARATGAGRAAAGLKAGPCGLYLSENIVMAGSPGVVPHRNSAGATHSRVRLSFVSLVYTITGAARVSKGLRRTVAVIAVRTRTLPKCACWLYWKWLPKQQLDFGPATERDPRPRVSRRLPGSAAEEQAGEFARAEPVADRLQGKIGNKDQA